MLEWLVEKGRPFIIAYNDIEAGYFILSQDNTLIEFFLTYDFITGKEKIFGEIIKEYSITEVLCKSFDYILLTCCLTFSTVNKVYGTIFRDFSPTIHSYPDKDIIIRIADKDDIPSLVQYKDSELYETQEVLDFMVSNKMLFLFERGKELIGCGYFIRIHPNREFYDIGMWTNPVYRKQGYASMIISYLKSYCLNNQLIPICGCAAENTTSRKTLEKCGFTSKHCVIQFKI